MIDYPLTDSLGSIRVVRIGSGLCRIQSSDESSDEK